MKNIFAFLLSFIISSTALAAQTVVQNGETLNISVPNCGSSSYADASLKSSDDNQLSVEVTCKPYICAYKKAGQMPFNYWSDSWIIFQAKSDQLIERNYQFKKVFFYNGNKILAENIESSKSRNDLLLKFNKEGKCASFMRVQDSEVEL